jgi:hypothetical protein
VGIQISRLTKGLWIVTFRKSTFFVSLAQRQGVRPQVLACPADEAQSLGGLSQPLTKKCRSACVRTSHQCGVPSVPAPVGHRPLESYRHAVPSVPAPVWYRPLEPYRHAVPSVPAPVGHRPLEPYRHSGYSIFRLLHRENKSIFCERNIQYCCTLSEYDIMM